MRKDVDYNDIFAKVIQIAQEAQTEEGEPISQKEAIRRFIVASGNTEYNAYTLASRLATYLSSSDGLSFKGYFSKKRGNVKFLQEGQPVEIEVTLLYEQSKRQFFRYFLGQINEDALRALIGMAGNDHEIFERMCTLGKVDFDRAQKALAKQTGHGR